MKLLSFIIGLLFATFMIIIIAVPIMLLDAWAFKTLWGWFVSGQFDIRAIGYAEALGLSVLYSVLKTPRLEMEGEKAKTGRMIVNKFAQPLLAVGTGWLVKYFGGL